MCGRVRYHFSATPDFVGHCYCRDCQKATGSAFTTVLALARTALTISGVTGSYTVRSAEERDVTRLFCQQCGSQLFTHAELNPDSVFVKCATLDDPNAFTPTVGCWTESRPRWTALADAQVNFAGNPEA